MDGHGAQSRAASCSASRLLHSSLSKLSFKTCALLVYWYVCVCICVYVYACGCWWTVCGTQLELGRPSRHNEMYLPSPGPRNMKLVATKVTGAQFLLLRFAVWAPKENKINIIIFYIVYYILSNFLYPFTAKKSLNRVIKVSANIIYVTDRVQWSSLI